MARKKSFLSEQQKKEIRTAQRRLRNSDTFMKNLAKEQGIERLSLKGSNAELALTLKRARYVNESAMFTKRGFNAWVKDLAEDTRLSVKQVRYALSQMNVQKMDYIENSKLRYGSNPQLDYIADNAVEIAGRYQLALEELQDNFSDFGDDIF